jgi:hypothetical protein
MSKALVSTIHDPGVVILSKIYIFLEDGRQSLTEDSVVI